MTDETTKPSRVENTTKRDMALHVLGSMVEGPSGYIEGMEAQGQRELVASSSLPSEGPWAEMEALGFVAGDLVPGDDLFRSCQLPERWTREGSDHAMWSYVLDERGVRRLAVFYKAAFYDRRAFCRFENVGYSIASGVVYGEGPVTAPPFWPLLTDDERDAAIGEAHRYLVKATEHPDIYAGRGPRARAFLEAVRA